MNRIPRFRITLPALAASALLLGACRGALEVTPSDHATVLSTQALDAPDPSAPGPYTVGTLYYGRGDDENRPEYRDSVTVVTEPVDASDLVSFGGQRRDREEYWGFSTREMPINGRVWYPTSGPDEGPFPLVLVVHGNHSPTDFSDPGYDYLGEHLASRGFILASVDMNFINGLREENDARGWFLLKHVEAWTGFNEREDGPLRGRVDLDNIALIGHSRGGEAVGHAAAFNRLDRYPDDASVEFDFGYSIKAIIAIAPVDGQYLPTGRKVPVEDVSYMVFHGSHDGDVTSFHGLRLYDRLTFSPESDHFKTAVYMYRANHGQWNTVWGSHDNGERSGRNLDLRYLVEPEKQQQMAKVYVAAFLESRLKGDDRWLSLIRDHRVAGGWLPETMYITRMEDASFRPLADFEEDIDVTTGSHRGVTLQGDSLSTWKEDMLQLRSSNRSNTSASQENQAVWLAWNNRIAGSDTTRHGPPATFTVELPPGLAVAWNVDEASSLHLNLAPTERIPRARRDPTPRDSTTNRNEEEEEAEDEPEDEEEEAEDPPVDLTVEIEDEAGVKARVALSEYGPIRRPLEIHIMRRQDQERSRFQTLYELVQQGYAIPMTDFLDDAPGIDLSRLSAVRLVFDRVHAGEVAVDEIGFAKLDPAFWEARLGGM